MAAHALGRGTCNLSINVRESESVLITLEGVRQIRVGRFRSVGAYVRHLILLGLEADNPAAARRLREIRNAAMSAALALLICASMLASWFRLGGDDDPIARRVRSARSVNVGGRRFETEA